jgi:hypothetical protein
MEDRAAVWMYARPLREHDMTIHCPHTHQPCIQSLDPQTEYMGSERSQSSTSYTHPPPTPTPNASTMSHCCALKSRGGSCVHCSLCPGCALPQPPWTRTHQPLPRPRVYTRWLGARQPHRRATVQGLGGGEGERMRHAPFPICHVEGQWQPAGYTCLRGAGGHAGKAARRG